jgi:hypothetical protein
MSTSEKNSKDDDDKKKEPEKISLKPVYLAIIGTACRNEDENKINKSLFQKIKQKILAEISKRKWSLEQIHLLSGGAAGIDHCAVSLFLDQQMEETGFASLTLYLPAKWDKVKCQYMESQNGKTSNMLHRSFGKCIEKDTLKDLASVPFVSQNVILNDSCPGFFERNSMIAKKATHVFAFTWNNKNATIPKKGGTLDTWNKCSLHTEKIHFCLFDIASSFGSSSSSSSFSSSFVASSSSSRSRSSSSFVSSFVPYTAIEKQKKRKALVQSILTLTGPPVKKQKTDS